MYRPFWLALVVLCLAALLLAQPADEANSGRLLASLTAAIQAELEVHGERVLGRDMYRWNTRLEKIEDCRAELSVRVTNQVGDVSVRTENVQFSLGALEPYSIDLQKNWLELTCAGKEKCIFSTSTCSKRTKDGIVVDCATASQKQAESFSLELDGDVASALRLKRAFRQAIDHCREPKPVMF